MPPGLLGDITREPTTSRSEHFHEGDPPSSTPVWWRIYSPSWRRGARGPVGSRALHRRRLRQLAWSLRDGTISLEVEGNRRTIQLVLPRPGPRWRSSHRRRSLSFLGWESL